MKNLQKAVMLLLVGGSTFVTAATCDPVTGAFRFFRDDDSGDYYDDYYYDGGYYYDDYYYDDYYYDDYYYDCFDCYKQAK